MHIDIINKAWKQHFKKANIIIFNFQFSVTKVTQTSLQDVYCIKLIKYYLFKQAAVIHLTYLLINNLIEQQKLTWQIKIIKVRVALCSQQESCHCCSQFQSHIKSRDSETSLKNFIENRKDHFFLMYKLKQCIFCLEDKHKSYKKWVFKYVNLTRWWMR